MLVQGCALDDFDASTGTCAAPVWIDQPGLLPPLPVEQGLLVSGAMITVVAGAWSLKYVRRFIWPRA